MQSTSHTLLNRIQTNWTLVNQAHHGTGMVADVSRHRLLERYCGAAWRYLCAVARDSQLADELFQEFALRLLRGDFRRAAPVKGRFRDYLKTVLVNLVKDHHRQRGLRPLALSVEVADTSLEHNEPEFENRQFLVSWREELLDRTWAALDSSDPTLSVVLRTHVSNPQATASSKAVEVGEVLSAEFNANRFRVSLHRARRKFALLLRQEVEESMENPTDEELIAELTDLRLQRYCRIAEKT